MGKKRPFTLEKRAQITIFMILGILLLLIFLFLMQVASQAQKSQLSREQEQVFTKTFQKESLRLFVDDCLQDELQKGLILLGKQGTLWADQPGGIKQFSEGQNGLTYSTTEEVGEFHSGRIAYALTDEHYFQFPGAYPCDSELGAPSYCQYHHPNISVGFGTVKLFTSTFTSDLRQYLRERTAWCVKSFILSSVSTSAEIVPTDMDLDLTINDEGINVKVNYPLKFKVGGEEIFSLSTFDFFYPSHFKKLLDVTTFALAQDQKLVDFNFTPETFAQPTFTYSSEKNMIPPCTFDEVVGYFRCERAFPVDAYQSLSITMATESLPNGNNIFTFTPALYEIVNTPEPYSLRIARQNRPPALDYIQRAACPAEGYDYLVIKNDERFGDINITPHAIDPDEDRFTFLFSSQRFGKQEEPFFYRSAADVAAVSPAGASILPNGYYNITVNATDEHEKADSQDVRVLVDRPIQVGLSLAFPESYNIRSHIGGGGDTIPLYVVSREDPILLHATIPAGTETSNLQAIVLNYADGSGVADVGRGIGRLEYGAAGISTEQCYNFPLRQEGEASTCFPGQDFDLNSYYNNNERINHLNDFNYYAFQPFQRITDPAAPGTLSLNFNTAYCGVAIPEQRSEIKVQVAACVPVQNPEHPFAYPYHEFTFDSEGNFRGEIPDSINPLASTHSCCVGDPARASGWRIKTAEEGDCFTNPKAGCYGRIKDYTTISNNKGYILEEEFAVCDGTRGNICGSRQGRLYQDKLKCGNPADNPECSTDIDPACQGQLAFGLIGNEGWCNGKMGCADFCQTALVYTLGDGSYFAADDINRIAQDHQITTNSDMAGFGFKCGCTNADNGKRCDRGFDGRFTGVCENGQCNDVVCTAGQKRCEPNTIRNPQQCNSAGTAWESTGTCATNEYCSNGECKPQTCTPKDLVCYPGYLLWVRGNFPNRIESVVSAVVAHPGIRNYPFFCTEEGSEYREVRAECSSGCNADVTVVEVNAERDSWECRPCGNNDWQAPNQKRCVKGGVQGVCVDTRTGSPRYQCRQ